LRFGSELPRVVVEPPGPRSREFLDRLAQVESRNITFRGDRFPVVWESAVGANVRDVDGNVFVDLTAAFGVALSGHADPIIGGAVEAAWTAGSVHAMGDVHPPSARIRLLERLAELSPWPTTRGVLANSGSEAVEIALKTALLYTGNPAVLAFQGGYHGMTLGALSVTARREFREPFADKLFPRVEFLPFPIESGQGAKTSLDALDRALSTGLEGAAVGAVILEPIQGRAGVRIPPAGFLEEVAGRVRAAGGLVIFDEIFTGFGRTGRLWAHEWDGVAPDLLVAGKALGGGLPLSVCMGAPEIMDAWPESLGEALHTSTFLGHPLACASALAFLDRLEGDGLITRSAELGAEWLVALRSRLGGLPEVREIRGRGMMLGIEVADPGTGGPLAGGGVRVAEEALRRGVLVLPAGDSGEVVELTPPVVIGRDQLEVATDVLEQALGATS